MRHRGVLETGSLALLLAVVLSPGAARAAPGDAREKRVVLGRQAAGTRVSLLQDELLVVELAAKPSAGYTWQVDGVDEGVLVLAGREVSAAPGLGGAVVERLLFQGVRGGITALSLAYRRPWEQAKLSDETWRADIAVPGPYTGSFVPARTVAPLAYVPTAAAPARLNLCDPGDGGYSRCTPVKDQGGCGGCWAFASAAVFENLLKLANPAGSYNLSEQYLISCNDDGYSCDGGGHLAFHLYVDRYVSPPETAAGAVYTPDFPFVERDVACGSRAHAKHEKLTGFKWVTRGLASVDTIKQAILEHGPVWAAVCADDAFAAYRKGTVFRNSCSTPNHAIVLVGWDDNGGDGYWILRNSWGAAWGDRGYMRIAYGASKVGYDLSYAVYPAASNRAPVADAGVAQTASPGATVTLDGSRSADADGTIARYAWAQTSGSPAVTLRDAGTARATFVAPAGSAGQRLGFTLTVTDDDGASSSATTTVELAASNAPPVAEAGPAQTARPGATVTLDGRGSSDADGSIASFAWTQSGGPAVTLSGAATARPSFVAPAAAQAATLAFSLTVKDDRGASASDTVSVVVSAANAAPTASAGAAQEVAGGAAVTLDGRGSSDPDGAIASFAWTQTAGPQVALRGAATATPTFTAPADPATLGFELAVADDAGATSRAAVTVTVGAAAGGPVMGSCASGGSSGLGASTLAWLVAVLAVRRRRSGPAA